MTVYVVLCSDGFGDCWCEGVYDSKEQANADVAKWQDRDKDQNCDEHYYEISTKKLISKDTE